MRRFSRHFRHLAPAYLALVALAVPGLAQAETATVSGIFPAPVRETTTVKRIGIARFDGQDGARLEQLLESGLANIRIGGRPYYDLIAGGGAPVDAILTGGTTGGVEEFEIRQTRQRCAEEKEGKCVRKEDFVAMCRKRTIDIGATVKLFGADDRRIIYSVNKPRHQESVWCPKQGDAAPASAEQIIGGMIDSIAGEIRSDLSPSEQTLKVRFLESRSGMPKDIADRFKAAVKQSQRDLDGACAAWSELNQSFPNNDSITFDLGLCAESRGEFREALALYQQAARHNPGKAFERRIDIDRAQRLIMGHDDYAARMRRP